MNVEKKNLEKSQVELNVEMPFEEFKPYIGKAVNELSKEIKIEGFRPGFATYDVLKQKIGEIAILEEAARLAIDKTIGEVIKNNIKEQPVGQPAITITKIAPENPMEYKIVISILPEVTLGEYKNLNVKKIKTEVSAEEIDKMIDQLCEMRVKEVITDRKAQLDDKVIVNIAMFLDKVPVEGGQSKEAAIVIGKDYLVPGFDKNLIGLGKGDKRDFSVVFPTDYYQKNLSGKSVEFEVEVKEVYERQKPKIDDEEFAKGLGMKDLDDLRRNLEKNLHSEKKQAAEQKMENEIIDKILETAKFGDLPEVLVDSEIKGMIHELEHAVTDQGGKFEDYLASIKKSREQLILDLAPNAVKRVKSILAIREIANKEKIEVSEKDVEERQEELLKQYQGYDKVTSRIKEHSYKAFLRENLTNSKVIKKLEEWNLID